MPPIYVLGTGLSHDGSAVLLRDGVVAVGIEKERLTRQKHDGGNDLAAVRYCLDTEGIGIDDVSLVVQCGLFETLDRGDFDGPRAWKDHPDLPVVTISHHLAHAYSAVGTAPFADFDILVVDGCGSPRPHCDQDRAEVELGDNASAEYEKDSFYRWKDGRLTALLKDFSPPGDRYLYDIRLPSTQHSIGGFYAAVSGYCLGNMDDAGKLMGLAPYANEPALDVAAFGWDGNRLVVNDGWKTHLREPMKNDEDFRDRFDYFAGVAFWAQREVERAMHELVSRRQRQFGAAPLALSGGVALNAVANAALLTTGLVDELYAEPAAGDNGIALGCAFYGWLVEFGNERIRSTGTTCFGRPACSGEISAAVAPLRTNKLYEVVDYADESDVDRFVASQIREGLTIAWMQDGCEFGPRALGRRSILAHPGIDGLRDHINRNIKFREDFRPFAPSMIADEVERLLVHGHDSPYMILVDEVREEHLCDMANVMHVDKSTRVQVIDPKWNRRYDQLVRAVRDEVGVGVVLNTSFNKRGQPIVESPEQAVSLFCETALDVLVMNDTVVTKSQRIGRAELGKTADRSRSRLPGSGHGAEVSTRDDLLGVVGEPGGNGAATDTDVETAMLHAWLRQGGSGCLFAQNRSRRPHLANYASFLMTDFGDHCAFDRLQEQLNGSSRSDAAIVHLPRAAQAIDLARNLVAFGRSEHWFVSSVRPHNDPEHVLIALRWPIPGTFRHSEVLGFADLDCLPPTRRAPTTSLILRTVAGPDVTNTAHLAQIPYLRHETERIDFYWQGTRSARAALTPPEMHDAAQAPVTYRLPLATWHQARTEPTR